ncbi:linoleate 13S-lipoxygenase 2-1, chloroplastic-like isoform X3 [Rhodamnia argentea]|uniref:Lipoxygenase n=1 Tax=Rhodamnia argentea TaxID=178133 RepID=A0ABM3HVH4_9MYRT|nr:linoleate 13S-lipoxygenase 2-1, chloroplastic-like isoform X3 [Rhodamnia argentea]
MLKPQLHQSQSASPTLFPLSKPFSQGNDGIVVFPVQSTPALRKSHRSAQVGLASRKIKAMASPSTTETLLSVKAVVTVKQSASGLFSEIGIKGGLDKIIDLVVRKTFLLELVSAELDPKTGQEKGTIKGYAHKKSQSTEEATYEHEFEVGEEFGEVGAILVENEHHKEMYLKDIVLEGFVGGPVNITCNSWVHSKFDNPQKRVFFTNKCYLPTETPSGLRRLREEELVILRGDGQGERKSYERIYDYDVYNDLGDPDSGVDKKRPVLGGQELPYPRRCRTGRPRCKTDPQSESKSSSIYVPRDEEFSTIKELTFSAKTVYSVVHAVLPSLETAIVDTDLGFPNFTAIDELFNEVGDVPMLTKQGFLKDLFPRLVKTVADATEDVLRFETPETMKRDKFFWFSDEEFARQTLAGINPYTIQLVTEWPLRSELDPKIYGPPESVITTEIIEREIKGFMTVDEAIKQKKMFMLDYHDLLLPYVNKVRQLKGTTLYGSRTLFFLTPDETLKPLAIELTRPPTVDGKPQWKQVFTPSCHSTGMWLWRLAKAHVLAHDSGYHQLVSHWLRTHCATEPYIIATNRQLSEMHPIYKLLQPHFRYTMEINALARGNLINGDGIIETTFSPGKYSMELSAVAYDKQWQFDLQGLPNDLISRGLAMEDPTEPHGLKLAIEDYPFANDGLLLWDIINEWVTGYVNHYYPDSTRIVSDMELQSWWTEIRTVGHGDKKDSLGWPDLKSPSDLIHIITTIVWVASGHHAAVNFGQYTYAGYFPNRPTIARTKMPVEDPTEEELKIFWDKPEDTLLHCFPSQIQATKVMAVLDVLSNHSPDEEYLGQYPELAWTEEPAINVAFERFNERLKEFDGIIDARNTDQSFKNRNGAGIVPYELLKPFSEPGVTGKGVPYSISI